MSVKKNVSPMIDILKRKSDHIDLAIDQRINAAVDNNPWDDVHLVHNALPEKDLLNFNLSTEFLGKKLNLPFLISSMTGGPFKAEQINANLAEAAQELGIAMGVGSQRIDLLHAGNGGLTNTLRKFAPTIPLYANLGAAQLRDNISYKQIRQVIDEISADALIIHLNSLQEFLQDGGDTDWRGLLSSIEGTCNFLDIPVIVKEVGMGISASVAIRLVNAGVQAIDVAGKGGTNFIDIEAKRATNPMLKAVGEIYKNWGITTPEAVRDIRAELSKIPLIASGGIRQGLDAAKAIKLGANIVAQAGPVLKSAMESTQAVIDHFRIMEAALRIGIACSE
jgi:isopentenyl-diphosphate delta-isomerase